MKIVKPAPSIKLPSNAMAEIVVEATDDFGVKSLALSVYQGAERIKYDAIPELKEPKRTLHDSFSLDLARLNVKPGSKLQYWATVIDTKHPRANRVDSSHYEIEVIDPAKPEEVAKLQQEANKDKDDTQRAQQAEDRPCPSRWPTTRRVRKAASRKEGQPGAGQGPAKPGEGGTEPGKQPVQFAGNDNPNPEQGGKPNAGKDLTEQDIKNFQNLARNRNLNQPPAGNPQGNAAPNGANPPATDPNAAQNANNPPPANPSGGANDQVARTNPNQPPQGGTRPRMRTTERVQVPGPAQEQAATSRTNGTPPSGGSPPPGQPNGGPPQKPENNPPQQHAPNPSNPGNPTGRPVARSTNQGGSQGTSGPNNPGEPSPPVSPRRPSPGARPTPAGPATRPRTRASRCRPPEQGKPEKPGPNSPPQAGGPSGAGSGNPRPNGTPNDPGKAEKPGSTSEPNPANGPNGTGSGQPMPNQETKPQKPSPTRPIRRAARGPAAKAPQASRANRPSPSPGRRTRPGRAATRAPARTPRRSQANRPSPSPASRREQRHDRAAGQRRVHRILRSPTPPNRCPVNPALAAAELRAPASPATRRIPRPVTTPLPARIHPAGPASPASR